MLKRLWLDEGGAILSAELILIMVILVIGMVVGLTALRDAVDGQLGDIAGAIAAVNPSYAWSGIMYDPAGGGGPLVDLSASGIGDGQTYAFVAPSGWDGALTPAGQRSPMVTLARRMCSVESIRPVRSRTLISPACPSQLGRNKGGREFLFAAIAAGGITNRPLPLCPLSDADENGLKVSYS